MRRRRARQAYEPIPESVVLCPSPASVPVCRVQLVRETSRVLKVTIEDAEDAAEAFAEHLAGVDREHLAILMLDAKNRLLGVHTVGIGTLNGALVAPREVFKAAILANAASIIVGHNHPSGDPTPSPEDYRVTECLKSAGELLEIPVLDHLVIGECGAFTSLRQTSGWPLGL